MEIVIEDPDIHCSARRCSCGHLVYVKIPCLCDKCGKPHPYWRIDSSTWVKISSLGLDHLTNIIKVLGFRAERYPSGPNRQEIEIALDLVYVEIGSRGKEIDQATGIMNALKKALASGV